MNMRIRKRRMFARLTLSPYFLTPFTVPKWYSWRRSKK